MLSTSNSTIKHIFIIAGEASGDALAAQLISNVRALTPDIHFTAMGGRLLQRTGCDMLIDAEQLAVVGAWEIVTLLAKFWKIYQKIKLYLQNTPPDLIILVDYPGFNLRIAKLAKRYGIKVLYYVSPQIWAWRQQRIHKIKKWVDHMMVLFAFEQEIYQQAHIPVSFVGHPLLDTSYPDHQSTHHYEFYSLDPQHPIIALLPGSRPQEIQRLLPVLLTATKRLQEHIPTAQFILPVAPNVNIKTMRARCPAHIKLVQPPLAHILPLCHAAIVTSGTATLEVALCQTPMVIVYKTSWLTYWLAKRLIKLDKIGLCNIVAGKFIVKELIQYNTTPKKIAAEVIKILQDQPYRQSMLSNLAEMRHELGDTGASARAARVVLDMLRVTPIVVAD